MILLIFIEPSFEGFFHLSGNRSFVIMTETEKIIHLVSDALKEDIGEGDVSTLCCIDKNAKGKAVLKIKQNGVIAGVDVAAIIFRHVQQDIIFNANKKDGERVNAGEIAFEVEGGIHTILK